MTFTIKKNTTKVLIARVLLVILIISNLSFIWVNSSKESTDSTKDSKAIAKTVTEKVVKDYDKLPKTEQKKKVSEMNGKIRSVAHFTEFIPLGLLFFLLALVIFEFRKGKLIKLLLTALILSILLSTLSALADEIHQIFVKGRSFEVKDILTDTLGALCGCAIATIPVVGFKNKILKES